LKRKDEAPYGYGNSSVEIIGHLFPGHYFGLDPVEDRGNHMKEAGQNLGAAAKIFRCRGQGDKRSFMPRSACLDRPGVLHHVMGRGTERGRTFWVTKTIFFFLAMAI
jgi:hypothetical protein